jgi:hypothetical protein
LRPEARTPCAQPLELQMVTSLSIVVPEKTGASSGNAKRCLCRSTFDRFKDDARIVAFWNSGNVVDLS